MNICLFDIDGTLLSSGGAGKAALESAFTEEFQADLRHHIPYSGRTDRAIIRDLFTKHDIADTPVHTFRLLEAYLARLPASLVRHEGRVLPGIVSLLAWLKDASRFAVGLLTGNVQAGARTKLDHYGLTDHFHFGGFGDHHFDRDDVAREALASIRSQVCPDVSGDSIWVIGDTPLDVQCARAIGARAVAVATGIHTVEQLTAAKPDFVFRDLSDITPLLACWS